jgi:hypothetical protein
MLQTTWYQAPEIRKICVGRIDGSLGLDAQKAIQEKDHDQDAVRQCGHDWWASKLKA